MFVSQAYEIAQPYADANPDAVKGARLFAAFARNDARPASESDRQTCLEYVAQLIRNAALQTADRGLAEQSVRECLLLCQLWEHFQTTEIRAADAAPALNGYEVEILEPGPVNGQWYGYEIKRNGKRVCAMRNEFVSATGARMAAQDRITGLPTPQED